MIIIQSRSTSERLFGKALIEIGGIPIVRHCYNTCIATGLLTVVAVPTGDEMIPYLQAEHIPYFEGDEKDVLARFYHCAKTYRATSIIRVTADCPLLDLPYLLFVANVSQEVPLVWVEGIDGQDVERFSMPLLEAAHKDAQGEDREHVVPWMKRQDPKRVPRLIHTIPFTAEKMSVDTQEDLKRVREIYANRHPDN